MAAQALKEMSDEELAERTAELRHSLFNLRVRNTTKELENTSQIALERKELARAMTAQSARRNAAAKAAKSEAKQTAEANS